MFKQMHAWGGWSAWEISRRLLLFAFSHSEKTERPRKSAQAKAHFVSVVFLFMASCCVSLETPASCSSPELHSSFLLIVGRDCSALLAGIVYMWLAFFSVGENKERES